MVQRMIQRPQQARLISRSLPSLQKKERSDLLKLDMSQFTGSGPESGIVSGDDRGPGASKRDHSKERRKDK